MLLQMVLRLIWKRQVRVATCNFSRRGGPVGVTCWGGVFRGHSRMKSRSSNTPKDGGRNTRSQDGGYVKPLAENFPSKKYRKDGLLRVGEVSGIAKGGNSSSSKPSQNPSTDGYIRKSSRICTVLTPFQPENTPRKKGQEIDKEELKLAAASARDARQKACSNPFWEQTETLFAPITPEDLLLLKQPRPYEVQSGIQFQVSSDERDALAVSQISSDERDALDVITKDNASTEHNSLEQGPVSKLSPVPSLLQRALAALIDEDEIEHMEENESEEILEIDGVSEAENTRSESDQHVTVASYFNSSEQRQADEGARFMREYNLCKVMGLPLPKKVKMPKITSLADYEYQTLSLNEKLMLEFQSLGFDLEMPSRLEENVGSTEQEIKELEEKLHQQGSAIKEKLTKIEKAIEHEQDIEKRTTEEAPLEKLVEIANKKLPAWRKNRFAKNLCTQKNLAFIERTLERCKEYEETGRSCFSVLSPQDTMLRAPPCTTDKENVQLNRVIIASTDSTEAGKRGKARASAPSTSVSGASINKTKRKRGADKPLSTALQTPVPSTDLACSHSSEPSSNQDLPSSKNNGKVNNDEVAAVDEEDESDQEVTRLIRSTKRKKMSDVLASCSTVTLTEKHDEQPISSSDTPTEKHDEQPISSSKTRPVDNVEDTMDLHRTSIGEEDGLRSFIEYMDKEDEAMQVSGVGLDVPMDETMQVSDVGLAVPMDNLYDVDNALRNGWR